MPITILLADDHTLLRQGLSRMLNAQPDFSVVAEAASGLQAVELARQHQPDVTVMDIGMNELNGIDATAQLLRCSPRTAVVILSMHRDERYVIRAVKAGARGYLLKDAVEEELVDAVRMVHKGESFFSAPIATLLLGGIPDLVSRDVEDRYELLTERERQIYQLLAEGNTSRDVATRLGLSLHTVETHRARIMEKLDVHSATELALSAVRRGIVCCDPLP